MSHGVNNKEFTVAAVQLNGSPDPEENLVALDRALAQAEEQGATVAVLPENLLCMGRRDRDKYASADDAPHWAWRDRVMALGVKYQMALVAGSLYGRESPLSDQRVLARCWVTDAQGKICGHYDKRHLFDVEAAAGESYRESRTIRPGDNPPVMVQADGLRWGLSICYDLRFPEHYQALREQGAEVLAVPAAFTETTGAAHWETLLRARAIENQCYLVAANQCGTHASGRRTYGHSMIIDPWGRILADAGVEPGVISATLDLDELHALRERFPVHRHRRTNDVQSERP